eukprot:TRINITY_DN1509_c0_g4_i2.p1 TRINITY_DN1509_c0_g4~~TRINITY_DN1509_c0_g4_i2.p1  ORF type:complete len:510 (+),score=97.64 TRINITY_DN1509_c0_g4_i2:75-1604(+)
MAAADSSSSSKGGWLGFLARWNFLGGPACFSGVVPASSPASSKARRPRSSDSCQDLLDAPDSQHRNSGRQCGDWETDTDRDKAERPVGKRQSNASIGSIPSQTEGPELFGDSLNVPWFKEDASWLACGGGGDAFVHTYFVKKEVSACGTEYTLGDTSFHEGDVSYPPLTYDRRVSTNTWQSLLAGAMLEAGLRLTSLQANFKLMVEMLFSQVYAEVSIGLKLAFVGLFMMGVSLWFVFGMFTAWSYRAFIHPDNRVGEALAFSSAAMLSMFAIPNDVVLMSIHMQPQRYGGLLQESNCIQGNKRWPVHTIGHHCKADHDYTNWSGSKVQLPLFLFIDVGCSFIVVYTCFIGGIMNFSSLLQMSTTFLYAFYRVSIWVRRWHLRRQLFGIWLETCCDTLLPESRRKNVIAKYVAEGGSRKKLLEKLEEAGLEFPVPHSRTSEEIVKTGLDGLDKLSEKAEQGGKQLGQAYAEVKKETEKLSAEVMKEGERLGAQVKKFQKQITLSPPRLR